MLNNADTTSHSTGTYLVNSSLGKYIIRVPGICKFLKYLVLRFLTLRINYLNLQLEVNLASMFTTFLWTNAWSVDMKPGSEAWPKQPVNHWFLYHEGLTLQCFRRNISHHGWVTKLDRESAVSRCCHLPCHRQHTDTDHPKSQRQA